MTIYKYNEIRDLIKTGDVFATSGNSWFSKITRFFTRSKISHVGIFIREGNNILILESNFSGVVFGQRASNLIRNENIVYWGQIPPRYAKDEETIKNRAFNRVGRPYDMKGALISLFKTKKDKEYFCSEVVEEILDIKSPISKRGTTPDDIFRLCGKKVYKLE